MGEGWAERNYVKQGGEGMKKKQKTHKAEGADSVNRRKIPYNGGRNNKRGERKGRDSKKAGNNKRGRRGGEAVDGQ